MAGSGRTCRIGLMGLGQIGRQLFRLAAAADDLEIVAVADIGRPDVLRYLLETTSAAEFPCRLEGNYLRGAGFASRMLQLVAPGDVPWDAFGVDCVIDATGRYRSRVSATRQIAAGGQRVIYATLTSDPPDRVLVPGINLAEASAADRMVTAGSPTTNAFALLLDALDRAFGVEYASMTTIHAYTSDQPLQDYAQGDARRSRSAAQNIIPNANESAACVEQLLPRFAGRLTGSALNVPVQHGSLLDVNAVLRADAVTAEAVNEAMRAAAAAQPELIGITEDPIVSSDVLGSRHSLLFDSKATQRAGKRLVKTLAWYETLGHACRVLDVARAYAALA
jgi:glyceraldehyde 3-phosphate dehydrogenase